MIRLVRKERITVQEDTKNNVYGQRKVSFNNGWAFVKLCKTMGEAEDLLATNPAKLRIVVKERIYGKAV